MKTDTKYEQLKELFDEYQDCKKCGLCDPPNRDRINVVFGQGDVDADVMIIGDSPRTKDEVNGDPFSEESDPGKLVNNYLKSMNVDRQDVWIDHIVACRPTKPDEAWTNRPPNKTEMEACRDRINRVIRIIDPKIILLLGRHALRLAKKWADFEDKETGPSRDSISVVATKPNPPRLVVEVPGIFGPVRYEARATFHPAHILRLKQSDLLRENSDAAFAFETWKHTFQVVDTGTYLYWGDIPPKRGVDI